MTEPMADTSATGEPATPPNKVQPNTLDMPRPSPHMADQAVGEAHDALGNAAMQHQLTGKGGERNSQEGEHLHASHHFLEHQQRPANRR